MIDILQNIICLSTSISPDMIMNACHSSSHSLEGNLPAGRQGTQVRHTPDMRDRVKLMYSQKTRSKAKKLRKHMTDEEKFLWSVLKDHNNFPARFRRQHPLGSYIVDFYSRKAKLVVELDGEQHADKNALLYDKRRTDYLQTKGLKVLRFWNSEIWREFRQVQEIIYDECERRMEAP